MSDETRRNFLVTLGISLGVAVVCGVLVVAISRRPRAESSEEVVPVARPAPTAQAQAAQSDAGSSSTQPTGSTAIVERHRVTVAPPRSRSSAKPDLIGPHSFGDTPIPHRGD